MSRISEQNFQNIIAEWHPTKNNNLLPSMVSKGSVKKVWWLGQCGHEWRASPNNRSNHNQKCPYCSNRKILSGFNDLKTCFPEIAKEWHPIKNGDLKPNMVAKSSNKKIWWLYKCGHEWEMVVCNRTLQKQDCPVCKKEKRKNTNLLKYGVSYPMQNIKIASKSAKNQLNSIIKYHWKTNEELICQSSYEPKVVDYFNKNKIDFQWQIMFKMPNNKTYRVDAYLPNEDIYIEIKGYFRKDAKEKFDWLVSKYPKTELWNREKLKELGIL